MTFRLEVLNGPNLGLLGAREPELYGTTTLAQLADQCQRWAEEHGHELLFRQTDDEGELVAFLITADEKCHGVVLNAGAYSHTSVAVRDAVAGLAIPVVELHLTNPAQREDFRRRNLITDVVVATVQGFGAAGYLLALRGLETLLQNND